MKNYKSYAVLIPAIGVVTFMLSQWLSQPNQAAVALGLNPDAMAGLIVGLGIGAMVVLLIKIGLHKTNQCER